MKSLSFYLFFVHFIVLFSRYRTKEDELEELQLREELKLIDAAIKKNKKVYCTIYHLCCISILYVFCSYFICIYAFCLYFICIFANCLYFIR